ncbi:MAG: enoyl-CoA hydratase/isomerase family protein, partial [Myxococcales bacterium]
TTLDEAWIWEVLDKYEPLPEPQTQSYLPLMRAANRLFEDEDFMGQVLAYARQFVPPHRAAGAVGRIKRAVQSGLEVGLESGLALERELQQLLFTGEDAREGLGAYLEKRPPVFSGR